MGKRWKTYLYVPVLALALAFTGVYLTREQLGHETEEQRKIYNLDDYFDKQESVIPDAHAVNEQNVLLEQKQEETDETKAQFILRLENDFVVVYRTDDESQYYMLTGISSNDLPENTIQELKAGKEILDEEALYFFLESHSS